MKKLFLTLTLILLISNLASAVVVNSVFVDTLAPGEEGIIQIEVKNIFSSNAKAVSLSLQFANTPFIPIGSSDESVNEIKDGDEENFIFRIKASNTVSPGNYEIPYTLSYELNNAQKSSFGTLGIQVAADPELFITVSTTNPVIGQSGKISMKIINKGFLNARFVSVKILPEGFTLTSDPEVYVGEIQSDDFETVNFDAIFTEENPNINAIVIYKDFDNKEVIKLIEFPLIIYSQERAIGLGIIKKSQTSLYFGIIIFLIIIIAIWRILKKRRRLKKSIRKDKESFDAVQ